MSNRDKRLKRITVPKKIMLLLYDNQKYVDQYEVPEQVSQNGIAAELNLRQNHVSRALNELISNGLIFSRTSHVKNISRRRRVYFLTKKGIAEMERVIRELSTQRVMVHNIDGELREYSLKATAEELRDKLGYLPSYHILLNRYYDGIEIDLNHFCEGPSVKTVVKPMLSLPINKRFYGRAKDSKKIIRFITDNTFKMIVIKSIAGQGKTSFLIHIASRIFERPVYWYDINEYTRPSNIFNDWAYFLKEHRQLNLYNYLGSSTKFNLQDALRMFLLDVRAISPIFIIDDFQKAEPEIVNILSIIKNLLKLDDKIVFLVSSREELEFYNRRDVKVSKTVYELELAGLDKESAYKILMDRGISESEMDIAYDLTQGHPLALELYNPSFITSDHRSIVEFNTFLGEELLNDLSEHELVVVKLASVFQRPVSSLAFFINPKITQETLDELCKKLILRKYQNGTYDIHDLIKSYFFNRMTKFEKQELFLTASEYYSNSTSEKDILDYLRLVYDSGQRKRFITALLENGEFLLSQGYHQVGDYIQDIEENEVSNIDQVRLLILKSDASLILDDLQLARKHLKNGLEKCDSLLQSKLFKNKKEEILQLVSKIYNRSAEISKQEGKLDETIKVHKKSIQLNRRYNNKPGLGKAFNNLAIAYRERGELDLAMETLQKAETIFRELNNLSALALVEINLGDLYMLKKKYNLALKHFQGADNPSLKNLSTRALAQRKIGLAQLQLKQYRTAGEAFLRSVNYYKQENDVYNVIKNLNDLFKCAWNLNEQSVAKEYLDNAEILFEQQLDDRTETALRNELYSEFLRNQLVCKAVWDKKGLRSGINEYINFHLENFSPRIILENLEVLKRELKHEKISLIIIYKEIEHHLWLREDKHPAIIVGIYRAELLHELNRKKEIKEIYNKVYPEAKGLKFKKAVKRIKELMGKN